MMTSSAVWETDERGREQAFHTSMDHHTGSFRTISPHFQDQFRSHHQFLFVLFSLLHLFISFCV